MSVFGPGISPKPDLYHLSGAELRDVDRWTATGTNQTASVQVDATYGVNLRSVLGGADNDEGSHTLDLSTIFHPASGDKFFASALCKVTEANTDDQDFFFGFFDTQQDLWSDTVATLVTTTDFIGIYKVNGSLFWRAGMGNDATQSLSGVTTIAATSALWYRLEIEGEVTDAGVNARFYASDMSGAASGRNLIYTIGYGSSVSAQAVSGFTAMYFGVTHKTGGSAERYDFIPEVLRIEQSGT